MRDQFWVNDLLGRRLILFIRVQRPFTVAYFFTCLRIIFRGQLYVFAWFQKFSEMFVSKLDYKTKQVGDCLCVSLRK